MIKIQFVKAHVNAKLPVYSSKEAAGADVHSTEAYTIYPGENKLVDTGLDCVIPKGYELQVRPRSGMALKNRISIVNAPGTIDSDYSGRIGINLINLSNKPYIIEVGDRIAQIVVAPVIQGDFSWTTLIRDTERGTRGFGSTGV